MNSSETPSVISGEQDHAHADRPDDLQEHERQREVEAERNDGELEHDQPRAAGQQEARQLGFVRAGSVGSKV